MHRKMMFISILCLAPLSHVLGVEQSYSHVMFDDFNYANFTQAKENGWMVRTEKGHPGVKGATWWKEGVTFHPHPLDHTNFIMRLTSKTDGTSVNTRQTQVCHKRKYREGTYAARVYFNDIPQYGPDGDGIVETFYAISPLVAPMDKNYSEMDFEYLANGGWGEGNHALFATSWETFQLTPWTKVNQHDASIRSLQGWNTLVLHVADNTLRYYINGRLFATHGPEVFPEVPMSINFNLWFIQEQLVQNPVMRQYYQDVDWVYFAKDTLLSTHQVTQQISSFRNNRIEQYDSVPEWSPKQKDYCSL
ncbi:glycoside hydrolase family 16 protein [Pseudoalteromonas sp. MMG005]|uniref:glycoside hydrolase family 16 protein n=1 Tax=Pseudoalteromonas sp. MMG005 TaxID=2822682 RepID=UPI001FFCE25A|nr:glycoside hydrolase family 16 protein [Pseudoalteromonas sp. MMG005]